MSKQDVFTYCDAARDMRSEVEAALETLERRAKAHPGICQVLVVNGHFFSHREMDWLRDEIDRRFPVPVDPHVTASAPLMPHTPGEPGA